MNPSAMFSVSGSSGTTGQYDFVTRIVRITTNYRFYDNHIILRCVVCYYGSIMFLVTCIFKECVYMEQLTANLAAGVVALRFWVDSFTFVYLREIYRT